MKKTVIAIALMLGFSTATYAGVSGIRSNGNVSGVPSYHVKCSSGSSYIIYKKNGTWYSGGSGHMGNRYDSWSARDVADYLCS